MFKVKSKQEIGSYLASIIRKDKTDSEFCREYMRLAGYSEDALRGSEFANMKNRLSQILKGEKAIQTHDLPIFTELLGVTCEAILTAGEYAVPKNDRLTNYVVAFSKDPEEWERYIHREDKLILNLDEYGKSVIDYALECGNYAFLKYLVDNHYIWFAGENEKDFAYTLNFGAGTSIERRQFHNRDMLEYRLAQETSLRSKMISLAIDNGDLAMLDTLKAREIPSFYGTSYLAWWLPDCKKYYDGELIEHIAASDREEILSYFAEPFTVTACHDKQYTFLFPYTSELLDMLVKRKSSYADLVLVKAIDHNKQAYERLKNLLMTAYDAYKVQLTWMTDDELIPMCNDAISKELGFSENGNIISFRQVFTPNQKSAEIEGITTNIVCIQEKSANPFTQHFIEEANELYQKTLRLVKHPVLRED